MFPQFAELPWVRNYFFVNMPETKAGYISRMQRRNAQHQLSGMLRVKLTTVDPLFIGSGFQALEGEDFVKQTLTENGRPVIPGSGLKGAVRQICRAVSNACVPQESYADRTKGEKNNSERVHLPPGTEFQCGLKSETACIVCDMFGKMGWNSKVYFSDFIAESEATGRFKAAQQFEPHPDDADEDRYMDEDGNHAYKFYQTEIRTVNTPQTDLLRAVPGGTVFTGEITYRNLDEKELGLLMFALGQSGTISLKLGGYRNERFGTVNLALTSEDVAEPQRLANRYIDSVDDTLYDNIAALEAMSKRMG